MVAPAETQSPAPRANAEDRANVNHNEPSFTIAKPDTEDNFAAVYLSERFGLALPLARAIAALARIGRSFA
jgi:hypothetical protein